MRRAQLPPTLLAVAAGQGGVVSVAQARDHGLSDKDVAGLVRRGSVVRVTRGVYDVGAVPLAGRSWDERRLRAAWVGLLAFGDDAVAVGSCALVLHGVRGLPATVRPEAAVPRGRNRRDRDGIALRQFDAGMTTTELAGRRVATLDWALAQAVPELPRGHALAVLDSALHQGLADADGLRRAHEHARGRRGVARRHVVWGLADARAESPLESFARLDCVDEGVPPHTLQLPVHDHGGRVVARGDMAWRYRDGRWLVAELDGRDVHDTPDAVFADRARQNRLVATGRIDVLRFTGRDVGTIGRTVRAALHR
ncbi:type IV toxin-antitoxin system AbiEi family antitoxin domain-containing protein [Cellulosimicrobium composti]|uniref:type IV toxin-antitoxin system AbiEi family antitoxin domain-containing protein n=1 Tax=Cellulosimicrobium composti TaxID=2672572 RepID=UPI00378A715A